MLDPQQKTDIWSAQNAHASNASGSENALPVGSRIAEFEIKGVIGEGGFGIVYLADDLSLERQVALKEYMPSSLASRIDGTTVRVKSERFQETFVTGLRSFVNEAKLLAKFDHPSLVKVYRFWEDRGTAYMAMPYYQGLTLKQVLSNRTEPPQEPWLRAVLDPILEAVEVLHREHCYHRDIAPDNILLLKEGRPLLLDFGAARRVISDLTQNLTVILKPGYAPIEQYAEVPGLKQGPWTDIYALAAVAYFAIAGRTPPPSVGRTMNDSFESLTSIAAGRYSTAFTQAIDQALSIRPENRPQDIATFRALLGTRQETSVEPTVIYAGSPGRVGAMANPGTPSDMSQTVRVSSGTDGATNASTSVPGKTTMLFAAGAVAIIVASIGGGWMLLGRSSADARRDTASPPQTPVMGPSSASTSVTPKAGGIAPPIPEQHAPAPNPKPDATATDAGPVRHGDRARRSSEDVDIKHVKCSTLVEAGERALETKSYDQAMSNAEEANNLVQDCPGAKELMRRARAAKDRARASVVIE